MEDFVSPHCGLVQPSSEPDNPSRVLYVKWHVRLDWGARLMHLTNDNALGTTSCARNTFDKMLRYRYSQTSVLWCQQGQLIDTPKAMYVVLDSYCYHSTIDSMLGVNV